MANDSWLEQELAELDEAEQFIQETMSNFVPTNQGRQKPEVQSKPAYKSNAAAGGATQVTNSMPKAETDVDKLTNQLLNGLGARPKETYDNFDYPPPPDLDDLIISQPPAKPQDNSKSTELNFPPPPPIAQPPASAQVEKPPPVMSKPAPPPVLPKPSRSTGLKEPKTGVGKVSIQLEKKTPPPVANKPVTTTPSFPPPPPVVNTTPPSKPVSAPPPVADKPATTIPSFPPPPPEDNTPPKSVPTLPTGIPKDIEKNSAAELDFLTNNLLLNMDNPKDEDFYGYCEKCNGIVEGEKVGCNALDKVYHIKCFTCEICNKELHGEPFYAVGTKTYCESCYLGTLEKCTVCSEIITGRILRASGKPYHPECFKCTECEKSLDGIPFTLDDSDNIYCVECYHQKFAPRCSVCNGPILPEPGKEETVRIIALDRNFHPKCYKCEKCDVQFSADQGCYPLDDHIYCKDCNVGLVQQLSA